MSGDQVAVANLGAFEQIKGSSSRRRMKGLVKDVDQQINQKVTAMMSMEVKEECWETCTSPLIV